MKIGDYLKKYKNLQKKLGKDREIISSIIEGQTGQKIDIKNIRIINNNLQIKTNPYKKSAILFKKNEILNEINQYDFFSIKNIF